MTDQVRDTLEAMFTRLEAAYGPQHWWPGDTATEVVVGAILTQNTAWTNVERAIDNLKRAGGLGWTALRDMPESQLAELIRPSGTFRVKARRLKAFVQYLWEVHRGSLASALDGELEDARADLLGIHGIGPETADAILLYAGGRPTFVVDAYTRRVLRRHGIIDDPATYEAVRRMFHEAIPRDTRTYNEFHALLVQVGKRQCGTVARCEGCPLADMPHDGES